MQTKCHAHNGLCLCLCAIFSRFRRWILKRSIPKVWGIWSFRLFSRTTSCSPLPFPISPLTLCSCFSFCIFFRKSKHSIWLSWSYEYPSFLIAQCHPSQEINASVALLMARGYLKDHACPNIIFFPPNLFHNFFFQNVPSHSGVVIGDIFKVNHLGMAWCSLILPPLIPFPS